MAVDTRAKRLSMANMLHGNLLPDPNTSGVDAGERATFMLLYSGIALAAPPAPPAIYGGIRHRVRLPHLSTRESARESARGSTRFEAI